MLEKSFKFTNTNDKLIEKIINDENVMINHMVLPKGDRLPEHFSNSNVYMIVSNGTVSLQLGNQNEKKFSKGEIINIPFNTKMNVLNNDDEICELFVIKAPSPKNYKE